MSSYQADWSRFETLDAHVLGVSVDSVPCKTAWADSLGGVSFDLLADFHPHGAVAEQYGVLLDGGISARAVFIVDRQGQIAWAKVYDIPSQPDNAEIFEALERLRSG